MRNRIVVVAIAACGLAAASTSAQAQDEREPAQSRPPVEITPYVSLGSGASPGAGAAIRWPLALRLGLELETAYRSAEVNGLSSNLSLTFDLPTVGPVIPYLVCGVGLDQYGTAVESPARTIVVQPKTALSVNAGSGIRVQADENWGVRVDARWFNDVGRGPERWRLYNGVTFRGASR